MKRGRKSKQKEKKQNLAFVFPPGLSKRIKNLQQDLEAKSAGEVLVKAISLLEISIGRKLEIKDDEDKRKWEIDEFEDLSRTVEIKDS